MYYISIGMAVQRAARLVTHNCCIAASTRGGTPSACSGRAVVSSISRRAVRHQTSSSLLAATRSRCRLVLGGGGGRCGGGAAQNACHPLIDGAARLLLHARGVNVLAHLLLGKGGASVNGLQVGGGAGERGRRRSRTEAKSCTLPTLLPSGPDSIVLCTALLVGQTAGITPVQTSAAK